MSTIKDASDEPVISVIVPCYNQARFLNETLDSILAQTYNKWECIIVNDGSTDNTEKVATHYVDKDDRFKYVFKENGGLSSARNKGLQVAKGEYIQFLDGDDFLHQDKLSTALTAFMNFPGLRLVLSNYQLYDDEIKEFCKPNFDLSQHISYELIINEWDLSFAIPIHCGLFHRCVLQDGFDEILRAKEDWLMWIRIFEQISDYYFIENYHVYYRLHNNNMIKNHALMQENTLLAYQIIHQMTSRSELKNSIFQRYSELTSQKIKLLEKNYHNVLESNSYRTGNLLITPFAMIKNWIKKYSNLEKIKQ